MTAGTTLFRTKEAKDQKTSIVEMCIRQPVIHITSNADYYEISLSFYKFLNFH